MPQAADLGDLMATTLRYLHPLKITDISTSLQKYVVTSMLLNKARVVIDSGTEIQFDVMTTPGTNARFTELYATDSTNVTDSMIQAQLPWRWAETSYAIDEREVDMNNNPSKIVDLMKTRRLRALVNYAELMENAFWSYPSSSETKKPHGVDYHVVKNASTGFNGGANSGTGSSTVENINPTVYTRWKNYTALYTNVTKDDAIDKLKDAMELTQFIRPVNEGPSLTTTAPDRLLFANRTTIKSFRALAESQNDNLGFDLDPAKAKVNIQGHPLVWVPKLDADTTYPIYGLDFGTFKTYVLRNRWLKEKRIQMVPGQRNVSAVYLDSGFNWVCLDRRANFVLATSASYVN